MAAIEITVPMLPPKQCSTNSRVHWAVRNKFSRMYKEAVYYCSCAVARPAKPYQYATLEITCIVAQNRVRDDDNWKARFKPGQDALVSAGIIAFDDSAHITVLPIKFVKDKYRAPATIIKIQEGKR